MLNIKSVFEEVLFEKREKGLNLFYDVNIFVQAFEKPEEEEDDDEVKQAEIENPQQPTQPIPAAPAPTTQAQPVQQESKKERIEKILNEEIYKQKTNGQLFVTLAEAQNIQTLEDLLDFLSDQKSSEKITDKVVTKSKKIIDDSIIELIKTMSSGSLEDIKDLISKGDRVLISIDYGNSKEDSVGINLNKNSGTDTITLTMKKDNKIIPGRFDEALFNRELLNFRNEIVE